VAASATAPDPGDNQACVLSSVTVAPEPVAEPSGPLARTGPASLPVLLGGLLFLSGLGLVLVERRRRTTT
jgi:hypothetical protein